MGNYIAYHVHTDDSLLDSCTKYHEYIDMAVELGQKAICFTEHGNIYNWVSKKMYCDKKGIKYLHGVEIYITKSLDEKLRDNMHTILIAKNMDGFREINKLVKLATTKTHTYYKPRITVDEFLNISDNVLKISACLASPLNQIRKGSLDFKNDEIFSKYDYYEIQLHETDAEQREYNEWLYELSMKNNIPLIVGTDYHSATKYKGECREVLQLGKGIDYSLEDSFDLSYKTYDELLEKARLQKSNIPFGSIIEALNNTNDLYDICEDIVLDTSFKYPTLSDDDEKYLEDQIWKYYKEKCDSGIIDATDSRYIENLKTELEVFKKLGMCSFIAYMGNLVRWCRSNDIPVSPNRGSVGGSTIAYVLGIIDVNPVKWNTIFSRFANEHRKELGDIDLDFIPRQRPLVFEHIKNEMPEDKTARILSMGSIADLNCIEIIGKALKKRWFKKHPEYDEKIDEKLCPYSLDNIARIKKEFSDDREKTRDKYKDIFYYYDGLLGANISQQYHNAGIIVSPVTLTDNYGTFCGKDSDGNDIDILQINMDEAHDVCLVKYDILGLNTLGIVHDAYKLRGLEYPYMHQVDFEDSEVFEDIKKYPIGIFQFEGEYSHSLLKKYDIKTVNDMTLCNACLRPSGASYRDRLMSHEFNHNPSKEIDELLKENRGFLIYQEDTIKFLTDICGMSGGDADNIRRAIGHKDYDRLNKALPEILDGYCNNSPKPREVAEGEAKQFLKIIEDSASYQFGFNHSTGYSMLGYICGYLRHYYPLEFTTAYLSNVEKAEDFTNGEELAKFKGITILSPVFRKSKGEYFFDSETNSIYKGIGSMKYMNNTVGDELYELRDNKYDSFVELLKDIKNTSCDSRQLDILIKIGFFNEFGSIKKLLEIVEVFNTYYGKKTISKDKIVLLGLDHIDLGNYATDKSEKTGKELKTWRLFDVIGLIEELSLSISNDEYDIHQLLQWQNEILGYIGYTDSKLDKRYAFVQKVDGVKGTRRVNLYCLNNGKTSDFKISGRLFSSKPFKEGDIIYTTSCSKRYKAIALEKDENDKVTKWGKDMNTIEWWLDDYRNKIN